jgi:hypothetical protein
MVEIVRLVKSQLWWLPVGYGMTYSASFARSSSVKGYNLLLQPVSASAENGCIPDLV